MHDILEKIGKIGLVPVVRVDDEENAVPLAEALIRGGLPCAEITFRTSAAEEAIRRIATACPDMLVGAGTVLTPEQVDRAVDAGAKFIVSPGLNPRVVQYCIDKGIPVTPGCSCPSDIEKALELGLDVVKFFPAEQAGGIGAIKAMAAPYTNVRFMPTGGISAKNLGDYLSFDKIIACGGSWMVKPEMIAAGDFEGIERLTREAVGTVLGFSLHHVGINAENPEQSEKIARGICNIFAFPYKPGNSSNFAMPCVEVMKAPFRGEHGHIAIGTYNVDRAVAYLERQGFPVVEETAKYDDKGQLIAIYIEQEFGGFGIHLVKKPY